MKKYLFIINPVSGKGRVNKLLPEIESFLIKKAVSYQIKLTERPEHAVKIANENQNSYDVIISVGGDGTLNEVINGIEPGSQTVVGIIPIGSGNDFAHNLDLPNDLNTNLEMICSNTINPKLCDIAELQYQNGSDELVKKRFVNNFGLGFDAQVAYINQHKKISSGITSYIISVLRAFTNYKSVDYALNIKDNLIEGKKLLLTFGNGVSSGGGFYLTPNAKIDDNLLDITTIEFISRFKLLGKLPLALVNKLETVKEARMFKADKAEIKLNSDVYIHTDGEAALINTKRITVRVLEKKTEVYN